MHSWEQLAKLLTYFSSCEGKKITSRFMLNVDKSHIDVLQVLVVDLHSIVLLGTNLMRQYFIFFL